MLNPLKTYQEQMAYLQEENANYQRNIYQMMDYLPNHALEWEINFLQERIASNINHLKMLRVNILAIKLATNQLLIDTAEAIESINIIQDALQKQLANPSVARYYVQDYERLELTKNKLRSII